MIKLPNACAIHIRFCNLNILILIIDVLFATMVYYKYSVGISLQCIIKCSLRKVLL